MENTKSDISVEIKNFKAVKSANIDLNGISVISGVNGSGKSTVSKFIYYLLRDIINFDSIIKPSLMRDLFGLVRTVESVERDLTKLLMQDGREISLNPNLIYKKLFSDSISKDDKEFFLSYVDNLRLLNKLPVPTRIISVFGKYLGSADTDYNLLVSGLRNKIEEIFARLDSLEKKRPAVFLFSVLSNQLKFPYIAKNSNFSLKEYGDEILNYQSQTVPTLHSLREVVYIDTPMSLGASQAREDWDILNKQLTLNSELPSSGRSLQSHVSSIIEGDISLPDEPDLFLDKNFKYKRADGAIFDLLECATGLKSFSIIQLLISNGVMSENTLCIIDEPEAHLHPQWIVEYANLILKINKDMGVKFLISSHSPDMLNAIRNIAQKNNSSDKLSFYLAQEDKDERYRYNFKNLGLDIRPIFESFNVSIDKIEELGEYPDYGESDPD